MLKPPPPAPDVFATTSGGCRNCGAPLVSRPLKRSGPLKHRVLFVLSVLCCGVGLLLWAVWPREQEQTGVLFTCTRCGLQQT